MPSTTERELGRRLAAGNDAGFDQFLLQSHARVVRFVYRMIGWRQDVDEIVQEVYVAAWQGRFRFRGKSALETWLLGIAANKCRSWRFRSMATKRRQIAFVQAKADVASGFGQVDSVDSERSEQVRRAVQSLAASDRELIVMRYLEQLSTPEICEILGITPGTLDVRLHRARERLEVLLKPYMSEESP